RSLLRLVRPRNRRARLRDSKRPARPGARLPRCLPLMRDRRPSGKRASRDRRPSEKRASRDRGSLCLVLHSHMPYVEGFGTWPFGEEWLLEAIASSYLPLIDLLERRQERAG